MSECMRRVRLVPVTRLVAASIALLLVAAACAPAAAPTAAPAAPTAAPAAKATTGAAPKPAAQATPAAKAAQPQKLTVGVATVSAFQWPYYIAQEKGFYRDANIDLELVVAETNAKVAQGLLSGSVGIGAGSFDPHIKAVVEAGAEIIIVGSIIDRPVYSFVVQPEVKSYQDLKGKRVGVSALLSLDGLWMKQILEANGLKDGEVEIVEIGGTALRYQALVAKGIAAAWLIQPQDFKALREGFGRLGLSSDIAKQLIFDGYSTTRNWARQNEELLLRFLRVQRQTHQWLYDPKNKEEASQILAKRTNTDPTDATQTYDLWIGEKSVSPDASADPAGIKGLIDAMVATNQLKEPIPVERVLDTSYMQKAMR